MKGEIVVMSIWLVAWLAVTAFATWALWMSGHHVWSVIVAVALVGSTSVKVET